MNNKRNIKPIIFFILLFVLCFTVGGTIAYYTSTSTFTNEFQTGSYILEAEETFESPSNWLPGDTTPKEVVVTNNGSVDAAVRVCLTEEWRSPTGTSLDLYDENDNPVVIVNLDDEYYTYWRREYDENNEPTNCFYYFKKLTPNEATEPLLESVTFNKNFNPGVSCTTEGNSQVCNSSMTDYSGGTYTLNVRISTVQYSQYQEEFGSNTKVRYGNLITTLNIFDKPTRTHESNEYEIKYLIDGTIYTQNLYDPNVDLSNATCKVYHLQNMNPYNMYYGCTNALYVDNTFHEAGTSVDLVSKQYLNITGGTQTIQQDGSYLWTGTITIENKNVNEWYYHKSSNYSNDLEVMNFSSIKTDRWDSNGYVILNASSTFTMPNHNVEFALTNQTSY